MYAYCLSLGDRLCFSRSGAETLKNTLDTMKDEYSQKTIDSIKCAIDETLIKELKDGEDFAILYLDAVSSKYSIYKYVLIAIVKQ